MENILEIRGLHKDYQGFALRDVSFSLPEGCIAGFIGINGAGKTTTIRAMLGLAQKKAGQVTILGMEMEKNQRKIKDRIGVVLDGGCFYDELTMDEMKSIIAPAYSKWSEKDFQGYMIRFSLNPRQKIATLSKGMRAKFALALALSHHAELLIMDEPTSGLDPLVRSQLLEILADYMQQGGKGVFFSTHITSDLEKAADMLILINEGSILFQEDKDTLLDTHRMVKGDVKSLDKAVEKLFLGIKTTDFGFSGITSRFSDVKAIMPDALVEKAAIEDIMLSYLQGGKAQ